MDPIKYTSSKIKPSSTNKSNKQVQKSICHSPYMLVTLYVHLPLGL